MATLPAFLKPVGNAPHRPVRAERSPYLLRPLPQEDVFFYSKKIDNSRLVRESDPKSRGACWSAIGAACVLVVLLTSSFAPSVATTIAGYKLEALRAEERRLLNERRGLELQEAELLRPDRLEALAKHQNLVTPGNSQMVRLEGRSDAKLAMVK